MRGQLIIGHGSKRRESGFTIVEALIALIIVSVAMIAAARLLLESQNRSVLEQSRVTDPAIPLALQRLKADVAAAASFAGDWQEAEPLLLILPGTTVTYEFSGGNLLRWVDTDPQVLISGVTRFDWSPHGGGSGLLHLEVEYEVGDFGGAIAKYGQRLPSPKRMEQQTLILRLRGGGGVGW